MKKFIVEYLNIIGYALIGLVFLYSGFYFLVNVYHQKEIDRKIVVNVEEDISYTSIVDKVNQAKNNISDFKANNYHGSIPVHYLLNIQGRLNICIRQFENETFQGLKEKEQIGIQDVEKFRQSYQNELLASCVVEQLYDLAVTDETDRYPIQSLKEIAPYVELDIKSLLADADYITRDVQNNNVYYFASEHTSNTAFNKTSRFYSSVLSGYNRTADLLLELSAWFQEEVNK